MGSPGPDRRGRTPGVSSAEQTRIREQGEPREVNEILKKTPIFFARELDPRPYSVSAGRRVSHFAGGGFQRSLQRFTVLSVVKPV